MKNSSRALAPAQYHDLPLDEVKALAKRWRKANGPILKAMNLFAGKIEDRLARNPTPVRSRIDAITKSVLENSYAVAGHGDAIKHGSLPAAMISGAAGGAGGIMTSLAELPVTITLLMHAIRLEAQKAGFDPNEPWVAAECLRCFSSGAPGSDDDSVNTSFLSARMALNGAAIQAIIASVAPKLAMALTQKLSAQAVPVLGAVSGATLNAVFMRYYTEAAAIRFALLRLGELYGHTPVREAFAKETDQNLIK